MVTVPTSCLSGSSGGLRLMPPDTKDYMLMYLSLESVHENVHENVSLGYGLWMVYST